MLSDGLNANPTFLRLLIAMNRPSKRKSRCDRNGTAAVELSLVAPVFFLMVFGMFELTRMLMLQQAITNATREGCRTAKLANTLSSSQVEASVRRHLKSATTHATDAAIVRVSVPSGLNTATTGAELAVSVDLDYSDMSWMPFAYLGLTPTIRAEEVVQRE